MTVQMAEALSPQPIPRLMRVTLIVGVVALVVILGIGGWLWWTREPSDQGGVVRAGWMDDHQAAVATARQTKRPILINFTGSDWCPRCLRLRNEVFDTGIFAAWAKDHVVLLECDFPRRTRLPAEVAQQNDHLAERFQIDGFPTVVVISADGVELARSGYQRGGARRWIADLENLMRAGK